MKYALIFLYFWALPAAADIVVAVRTIPAQTLIDAEDLVLREVDVPGGIEDPALIIGMEARVALYANRPIRPGDVGFPAIVNRNEMVVLIYQSGNLLISTEGRALDRAGPGDMVRVMNLASRNSVTARMGADGSAYVSQ